SGNGNWAGEVAALPIEKRMQAVTRVVRVEVARVLGLGRGAAAVADGVALRDLGLDSLMAVQLRNALGRRAGVTLPATLALNHPTPLAIAKYLLAEVLSKKDGEERDVRGLLNRLSIASLEKSGLLPQLLALAQPDKLEDGVLSEDIRPPPRRDR